MKRVFHNETAFVNLDNFLMYFKLDYELFLTELTKEQPSYIAELNNVLDTISAFLEPMLIPCKLVTRTKGSAFGYAADSVERPAYASPALFGHGGKKRRHTQKKYKIRRYYYSRNKHKRISYRSRKT